VLGLLGLDGSSNSAEVRSVLQLTPELAGEIAHADTVVFLDAAIDCDRLTVEATSEPTAPPALTHVSNPAEIVALSTALFGFKGRAFQCRIPVADLAPGVGLSPYTERFAREAARILPRLCQSAPDDQARQLTSPGPTPKTR
jgi:Ni,Fe-hydrogenase maturation factor